MKKIFYIAIYLLILSACKKNMQEGGVAKLFRDTYWTGEYEASAFRHTYSMHFNNDGNTFEFYSVDQLLRITTLQGKYTINEAAKKLSVNIANGLIIYDASFSEDGKFTTFYPDLTSKSATLFLYGELNKGAPPKAGTTWKGYTLNNSVSITMYFAAGNKVHLIYPTSNGTTSYATKAGLIQFYDPSALYYYSGIVRDTLMNGTAWKISGDVVSEIKGWNVNLQH